MMYRVTGVVGFLTDKVHLNLEEYHVQKTTLCGCWVIGVDWPHKRHFVLKDSKKRFAWETKELALKSFIARKKRQKSILTAQLSEVEKTLNLIEQNNYELY